jgi:TRAP-type C4-dicarboxylate transport system permease small subunit
MPRHSKLGIISFVLSIISVFLVCLFLVFAYMLGNNNLATNNGTTAIGWVFICLIGLSNLTGIGLGIAALTQKVQNKIFGILGLVFNALILIGFCLFIIFAVFLAAGSLGSF